MGQGMGAAGFRRSGCTSIRYRIRAGSVARLHYMRHRRSYSRIPVTILSATCWLLALPYWD